MAIYIVLAILIGLLGLATFAAMLIGLFAAGGVLHLARCGNCRHLVIATRSGCPYCRHQHLAHPLTTLRHPRRELLHH